MSDAPKLRPLVSVIVYAEDGVPGVISVDVRAGLPVGDITPEEISTAVHVTADQIIDQLTVVYAAVRAESN